MTACKSPQVFCSSRKNSSSTWGGRETELSSYSAILANSQKEDISRQKLLTGRDIFDEAEEQIRSRGRVRRSDHHSLTDIATTLLRMRCRVLLPSFMNVSSRFCKRYS